MPATTTWGWCAGIVVAACPFWADSVAHLGASNLALRNVAGSIPNIAQGDVAGMTLLLLWPSARSPLGLGLANQTTPKGSNNTAQGRGAAAHPGKGRKVKPDNPERVAHTVGYATLSGLLAMG